MNSVNVMVDLETMGVRADAAIVSIGACEFWPKADARPKRPRHTFYWAVDLETSVAAGGTISASTVLWWLKQSPEARAVFDDRNSLSISSALQYFSAWLDKIDPLGDGVLIWGNGPEFDNAVLRSAYERLNMKVPWSFRASRCYRTAKDDQAGLNIQIERIGTHHNALDDAISQAVHLERIGDALRKQARGDQDTSLPVWAGDKIWKKKYQH